MKKEEKESWNITTFQDDLMEWARENIENRPLLNKYLEKWKEIGKVEGYNSAIDEVKREIYKMKYIKEIDHSIYEYKTIINKILESLRKKE